MTVSAAAEAPALLALATAAAEEAGALLMDGLRSGPALVESKTTKTDLVSDMDRASEALILERLLGQRPDDAVMAEEGSDRAGTSGVRWVIDPLDGTVNFVYGIPVFAVSIAAEVDGEVVAGVVHDPNRGETFSATLGGGAFLNGRAISANAPADLSVALVGTGFAYDPDVRRIQGSRLDDLLVSVRDIRRAGSAALDLCGVGAGRLDAYFERGTHHWDRAAGALVAREAGAVVGDLAGDEPSDVLVMAAAASIAAPFRALLEAIGASW